MKKTKRIVKKLLQYLVKYKIVIIGTLIGSLAGFPGLFIGLLAGLYTERIMKRLRTEILCSRIIEQGASVPEWIGEPFPGALYTCAIVVYCAGDVRSAESRMRTVFTYKKPAEFGVYCRAAAASELNIDLISECLAHVVLQHRNDTVVPLQKIFMVLEAAEFGWDEKSRNTKPSRYLSELIGYKTSDSKMRDAYLVLGLSPSASLEKVKTAHRRLVTRYHPDHGEKIKGGTASFLQIQAAYELILHRLS
ncbi:MAG: J domain-containing protein [Treponema sp.]|nr:J domain-containing protein [Treponema sp.]